MDFQAVLKTNVFKEISDKLRKIGSQYHFILYLTIYAIHRIMEAPLMKDKKVLT